MAWRDDRLGNPDIRARRATFHSGLDRFTFTYDGLNRLLSVTGTLSSGSTANESFAYDGATNLTSRTGPAATYTIDGANRVTSDGTRILTWDRADRLVQRGTDTFAYDALSRLTSSTVAGITRTYAYDGDGLLRSRTEGATASSFLHDPVVAPVPLLQAGTERLVYGLGPLYRVRTDGSFDAYARDGLGSVRAEIPGAGAVTNAYNYAAYGALRASLAGPPLLGFAGELADPSGLIYLRVRWYDPTVARFITGDAFSGHPTLPVSLNRYPYAAGNPVLLTDPTGRFPPLLLALIPAIWAGLEISLSITDAVSTVLTLADPKAGAEEKALVTGAFFFGLVSPGGGGATAAKLTAKAFRPGRWLEHFERHGAEFGYRNSVEYLRGAQQMVSGGEGVKTFVRANGDTLFYKATTNEFAVLGQEGYIRTYFRPEMGHEYWLRQTAIR